MFPSRYISNTICALCFILAIGCFYFSISEALFSWLMADEVVATQGIHNMDFFSCAKGYFTSGTINRLSAASFICLMAKSTSLFTPFIGWVVARLVVYIFIPISMAMLLKKITKIPLKFSSSIALIVSAAGVFILGSKITTHMFGIDLAIYGVATITFFFLVAMFISSIESNRYFIGFCLLYALNLNSHESLLAIDSLFIPLYAWYAHAGKIKNGILLFIKDTFRDKKFCVLVTIYCISALITLSAHSATNRLIAWPATGTFSDGIGYILVSFEETLYFFANAYFLALLIFLLGLIFGLYPANKQPARSKKLLYIFLLMTPFFYLCITGFLLGITPSLQVLGRRTEIFRQIEPFLIGFITNQSIINNGSFAIRQELFLYVTLFLDIFLTGFLVAGIIKKIPVHWALSFILLLATITMFLLHPDGVGGMKTLSAFFNKDIDLMHYSLPKEKKYIGLTKFSLPKENGWAKTSNILYLISPSTTAPQALTYSMFPMYKFSNHEANQLNIAVDHYLKVNQKKAILTNIVDLVYNPPTASDGAFNEDKVYQNLAYDFYHVVPQEPCTAFFNTVNPSAYCHNTFGEITSIQKRHEKMTPPLPIYFHHAQGMTLQDSADHCVQVAETPNKAEHFITSDDFQLKQGLNYLIFETKPPAAQFSLFFKGEKNRLALNTSYIANGWSKDETGNLKPIFSQMETAPKREILKIVLYSAKNQKINLRWQNNDPAHLAHYNYTGSKENISNICKTEYGQLVNMPAHNP